MKTASPTPSATPRGCGRKMVERVLTHCETDRRAAEPLLILLRRFATESAREEARLFCDELISEDAIAQDLIAA